MVSQLGLPEQLLQPVASSRPTLLLCFDVLGTNRQNTTHKQAFNDMSGGYNRFSRGKTFSEKATTCIWFRVSEKV